jgi:nitrogen fixation-related uncharacterized protein
METLLYMLLGIGMLIVLIVIYQFIWSLYKDREWRLNNPEEHAMFEQREKRQVYYLSGKGKTKNGT